MGECKLQEIAQLVDALGRRDIRDDLDYAMDQIVLSGSPFSFVALRHALGKTRFVHMFAQIKIVRLMIW